MMTLVFPVAPFTKNYAPSKYDAIIDIIYQITGVNYSSHSIRNYFHRVYTNKVKGFGKTKGMCRWVFYHNNVRCFLEQSNHLLTPVLQGEQLDETTMNSLLHQLKSHCIQQGTSTPLDNKAECCLDKEYDINYVNQMFEKTIMIELNSKWSKQFNSDKNTIHFYQFGKCLGYAEKEIALTAAGTWSIFLEGKHRSVDLGWTDIPDTVRKCNELKHLLDTIGNMKLCQGCPFDKYKPLYETHESESQQLFKTKDGTPAAFVDILMSKNKEKIARSSKCILLLWQDDSIETPDTCKACESTDHYLRTKLSRLKNIQPNADQKTVRYDYMSKDELLQVARNSVKEMKSWKQKCQRLDEYRDTMTTVGRKTDNDLQTIFKNMYEGILDKKQVLRNPVCRWQECGKQFENVELLYEHAKQHIEKIDTASIAPIHRRYHCAWETCDKHYAKLKLLQNHLREHTGYAKDELMEVLLKDQATALNTPSKQMRWHPLIIQWCLKMYSKSHSAYEGMRSSGALRLPSGRTLSDYKNYNSPQSGWHSGTLQDMKNKFEKMKAPKRGKLGGLFFDEVKIKEGLVFDSSSWELIGFMDIIEEKDQQTKPIDSLATHVLQFFYRSIFFKFDFPCAFFLTKGATAVQINRMFWLGVSLLHSYGFEIILVCCDGASTNRTFYTMNTNNQFHSEGSNPFTNKPIFFMSDPPHLMKKLRNNVFNSGFKEKNKRFTRKMTNGDKNILWEHVNDVYNRERLRSIYVTDLRCSHINLDNLSKMRVKLAVQTLSSKVADEMKTSDNERTAATQEYISVCSKFWNVLNSSKSLRESNCNEMNILDDVVKYFMDWQKSLVTISEKKAEQAKHFISWQTMFDLMVGPSFTYTWFEITVRESLINFHFSRTQFLNFIEIDQNHESKVSQIDKNIQ